MENFIVQASVQMILVGHKLIPYKNLYLVNSYVDLKISDEKIACFDYNEELISKCNEQNISFAIKVHTQTQAVIANATNASIIITTQQNAKQIQALAEYYLFDSKIALLIKNENEIQNAIDLKVDMAIFEDFIR